MTDPAARRAVTDGFEIVRRERIGSEWSEQRLEHDPRYLYALVKSWKGEHGHGAFVRGWPS